MLLLLFSLFLFLIVIIIIFYIIKELNTTVDIPQKELLLADNEGVETITPPKEFQLIPNETVCNKTPSPCLDHSDCRICVELLASCITFEEEVIFRMDVDGEESELKINPGESYCMALDRQRARKCNPNTGIWVLTETPKGLGLICSCKRPGAVTQLNMYEDCNIPIGCAPHGHLKDPFAENLECDCELGFVGDVGVDKTPFCRIESVRDVIYNKKYFPKDPCPKGSIRVDHEGLDPEYKKYFLDGSICVPDPCSRDPLTGELTSGYLKSISDSDGKKTNYCVCSFLEDNLPVNIGKNAVNSLFEGEYSEDIPNACIAPLLRVPPTNVIRLFNGQDDYKKLIDGEITFYLRLTDIKPEYENLLYDYEGKKNGYLEYWATLYKISEDYVYLKLAIVDIFGGGGKLADIIRKDQGGPNNRIMNEYSKCVTGVNNVRPTGSFEVSTFEKFRPNTKCIPNLDIRGGLMRFWKSPSHYPIKSKGDTSAPIGFMLLLKKAGARNYINFIYGHKAIKSTADYKTLQTLLATYREYSRVS